MPQANHIYDINQWAGSGSYKGDQYNYLSGLLKNSINTGMPTKNKLKAENRRNINSDFNSFLSDSKESLAARGMLGTGVEAGTRAKLYEGKAEAIGASDVSVDQMDVAYRQQAIAQLLGLNQFGANMDFNETMANVNYAQFEKSLVENQRQFNQAKEMQEGDIFGQIMGDLAGTFLGDMTAESASQLSKLIFGS